MQTIAELEQRWRSEVEDVRQKVMPFQDVFFLDYHLVEVIMIVVLILLPITVIAVLEIRAGKFNSHTLAHCYLGIEIKICV